MSVADEADGHSTHISPQSAMVKVSLNDTVLAESEETVVVEGNHYFPPESIQTPLFVKSETR